MPIPLRSRAFPHASTRLDPAGDSVSGGDTSGRGCVGSPWESKRVAAAVAAAAAVVAADDAASRAVDLGVTCKVLCNLVRESARCIALSDSPNLESMP